MALLIKGLKYIPPCQSRYFYSQQNDHQQAIDEILQEQYENISTTVKQCLNDNCMSISDARSQQAFSRLEQIINELKVKKFSRKLGIRAKCEYKLVQSIQHLLRQQPDVIICRVDKTKTLYVGNRASIVTKAEEYMKKTEAYEEIANNHCPLADNLRVVNNILDYVKKSRRLTEKQCQQLKPKLNHLELAHFHGLPKIQKVNSFFEIISRHSCSFSFRLLQRKEYHYDLSLHVCMHQPH